MMHNLMTEETVLHPVFNSNGLATQMDGRCLVTINTGSTQYWYEPINEELEMVK